MRNKIISKNGLNGRELKRLNLLLKGANSVQLIFIKALIEAEQEGRK